VAKCERRKYEESAPPASMSKGIGNRSPSKRRITRDIDYGLNTMESVSPRERMARVEEKTTVD
jgi:hypothetical protein